MGSVSSIKCASDVVDDVARRRWLCGLLSHFHLSCQYSSVVLDLFFESMMIVVSNIYAIFILHHSLRSSAILLVLLLSRSWLLDLDTSIGIIFINFLENIFLIVICTIFEFEEFLREYQWEYRSNEKMGNVVLLR